MSHPVKPVQPPSTHPTTRVLDSGRAGQVGSVKAAEQPVPTPQKQPHAVDYAQRLDVGDAARPGSKELPTPDAGAACVPRPSDLKVETEH